MTRIRRLLLVVLLAASVVALPGCAGSDAGSTPGATTASSAPGTAPSATTDAPPSSTTMALSTSPPMTRLVIEAQGVENLTVTLWNSSAPDGEPVYDRTFRKPDGALFLDHAFESRTSYHAVIRANGTVAVNRTLHASEGYRVEVTPNGTEVVTVVP